MAESLNPAVLISRPAAIAAGLTRYYTGKPCKYGHISERSVFNAGCLECWRPRAKAWTKANHVHVATQMRLRRQANPEYHKAIAKRARDRRRPLKLIANIERKARKLGAQGKFLCSDIETLLIGQGYLCANPFCATNVADSYTIDHKTPLIRGGSNWPRNLQLLCSPCNSSKWTKTQSEWLRSLRHKHRS